MKKIIIGILITIILCSVALTAYFNFFWDLDISIAKPVGSTTDHYIEQIVISGGNYVPETAKKLASNFSKECHKFDQTFYEEHKEDSFKIFVDVTFEDSKTIVTYKGTITDSETGETSPYEEQLVFDYIFTKTVNE